MAIQEGDSIPESTLHHMTENGPTPITTSELFAGKRTVLFAVPGAFTPGCSMQHLPGYVENSDAILDKNVDQIVCLSVNDPFVMSAWGNEKSADKILMIGDGNGELTESLGLVMDGSGFGLGKRSQRYAMIVDDGVVSVLSVESGPGLEVSSAESILEVI